MIFFDFSSRQCFIEFSRCLWMSNSWKIQIQTVTTSVTLLVLMVMKTKTGKKRIQIQTHTFSLKKKHILTCTSHNASKSFKETLFIPHHSGMLNHNFAKLIHKTKSTTHFKSSFPIFRKRFKSKHTKNVGSIRFHQW